MKIIKMTFIALALSTSVVGSAFAIDNSVGNNGSANGAQGSAGPSQDKSSTTTQDPNTPELKNRIPQGDACSSPDAVNGTTKCAPAPGAKQ